MGARIRILFIGEAITLSHLARPAVLAGTLDLARYDITFASDRRVLPLLANAERFRVIPLRSLVAEKSLEQISLLRDNLFDTATLEVYVREDLALFDQIRPDVVVGDMRQSLIISAQLRQIPFVNIMSAYWHPDAPGGYESPVNPLGQWLGEPWGGLGFNLLINTAVGFSTVDVNLACLRYGVRPPGFNPKRVLTFGDYLALPDIPEWSGLPQLPRNAAYVGPCIWSPDVAPPPWWDTLPPDRALIYLSLGSSGQPRLLQMIIRAVCDLPVTVAVATAGRTRVADLPKNVFVADYLNGAEMGHRARLAICNGGSTAGPQALAGGCPVLGVTSNMDQVAFMRRIEKTGAGEMVTEVEATEEVIRGKVLRMLREDRYTMAARRLAEAIRGIDTRAAFNGLIERALADRPTAHSSPPLGQPSVPHSVPPSPPSPTSTNHLLGSSRGTGTRPRILFIGEAVTLAHVARPAALAGMLDPNQFDLFFACDDRYAQLFPTPLPFRLIPLRSRLAGRTTRDHLDFRAIFLFDPETIEEYVREDREILDRVQPAVIVSDLRQSMAISARLAQIPLVNVMNAHFSPTSTVPWELPTIPYGLGGGVGSLVWTATQPISDAIQLLPLNLARVRYGLPPIGSDMRQVLCYGDMNLYPDLPELCPLPSIPTNHHYIGPLLWSPTVSLPQWWNEVPTDRPIVYVNLGSSGNPDLLSVVLAALSTLPVSVVAATAGRGSTPTAARNVYITDYLPGSAVARLAAMTVCNGGSMPGQQSLAEGTPVLGLPGNSDQAMFMTYVRRYGAGEAVPEADARVESIREAAARILREPKYAAAAKKVQTAVAAFNGQEVFQRVIDSFTSPHRNGTAATHSGDYHLKNGRRT